MTEGVKKVHARLRRKGIKASRNRINQIWGTDGTLFGTINGDLLWLFAVIDHFSDEISSWHIVEVRQGDRFATLEPIKQNLRRIAHPP